MNGIAASVDGSDVPVGGKWAPTALANRLLAAIDAGMALAADEDAGAKAVSAAISELKSARQAYNAGIRTASKSSRSQGGAAKAAVLNKSTVNAKTVKSALNAAGNANATTVTLGKNVKKIAKNAFAGTKVKTLVLNTKKLKKKSVKGCLAKSKVSKVVVNVGNAKANKRYVAKYKKLFVKKVAGKKASVK